MVFLHNQPVAPSSEEAQGAPRAVWAQVADRVLWEAMGSAGPGPGPGPRPPSSLRLGVFVFWEEPSVE